MADIFDQLAGPAAATVPQKAQPAPTQQGDIFDQVAANPNLAFAASPSSAGPTSEEQDFLAKNPDHAYMPADPKFPNRPAGIYPTGPGNDWRKDPSYEQQPVDLHFAKHTAEGAAAGAAAVGMAVLPGAAAGATERVLQLSEQALEHLGENYPQLVKLATKLGYGAGAVGAYKLLKKLGID